MKLNLPALISRSYVMHVREHDVQEILARCLEYGVHELLDVAYVLATADHESGMGRTMIERGTAQYLLRYRGKLGNADAADAILYLGRGYVQLTGRANYRKFGYESNPRTVAQPEIASDILVRGMRDGMFTGRKLRDYSLDLPDLERWTKMRAIVNGTDCAEKIANIAAKYADLMFPEFLE